MDISSDDESSDSGTEYVRPNDKVNFNSSTFLKPAKRKIQEELNEVSSDSDDENLPTYTNTELLSQILKNLEETNKSLSIHNQDNYLCQNVSNDDKEKEISSQKHNESITNLLLQGEQNLDKASVSETSFDCSIQQVEQPIIKGDIEIICPYTNDLLKNRGKKKQSLQELLRNRLNKKLRAHQLLIHKVGLLCWLSHGFYLNRLISNPEILAVALSLISSNNYPKENVDQNYLIKFTIWFRKNFQICSTSRDVMNLSVLLKILETKVVKDERELVLAYIAILRSVGINCRLVISLCPPKRTVKKENLVSNIVTSHNEKKVVENVKEKNQKTKRCNKKVKNDLKTNCIPDNNSESITRQKIEAKKRAAVIFRKIEVVKNVLSENSKKNKKNILSKLKEFNKEMEPNDDVNWIETDDESEDDFQEKLPKKRMKKSKNESRKLLSSDEDENSNKNQREVGNYWAEIYIESEASWICADLSTGKINKPDDIYKRAQKPVLYVIAWNSDGLIKDVTRRYCSRWLTVTRKQRINEDWWDQAIHCWKEKQDAKSKAEDEQLLKRELELPLPKTISECKGHPLYAITRHLLKYEALYPPDIVPLGYLPKGEAIYPRFCVHTLMSRQTWLKHARIVKPAQEPYKIVKSMPKYDKMTGTICKDQNLELFGKWQTDVYVPPVAKDGIVPRNEYGNVDLFKMCMLPKGTVHINLPGLVRIAKKLNIDCAPAVVGFNFGGRGATPATEGYVVCSEFEDILRDAWKEDQVQVEKRYKEKREKIIYANWKKIIKGLLIRKKLAYKYEFIDSKEESFKQSSNSEIASYKKKKLH